MPLGKDNDTHCRLRFQSKSEDAEPGLFYNLNRYRLPMSGLYLTNDPIGLKGGLRPQGYAQNPTTWIDRLGLENSVKSGKYHTFYTHYQDRSLRYSRNFVQF